MTKKNTLTDYLLKAPYIIHVSTPTSWRGGEQQVLYLIKELARMGSQQVLIAARGGTLVSRAAEYCEVVEIPTGTVSMFRWARTIARFSKAHEATIVHAHDSHAHSYAVIAASVFRNTTPIVVSRRVCVQMKPTRITSWKYNFPSIYAFVCASNSVRDITSSVVLRKDLLHTVYDGVNLQRFVGRSGVLRTMLGIRSSQTIVGNVAALTSEKDHLTFIHTAALIHATDPDIVFVIAGDGRERPVIERTILQHGLQNVVHLLGHRKDIENILPDFDVFLFTSVSEGLGTSVLDAMCAGVPVVATSVGGIPEVITHQVNGLLAAPRNAEQLAKHVHELLTHSNTREALIREAFSTVNNFSIEAMAASTHTVYQQVLQEYQAHATH